MTNPICGTSIAPAGWWCTRNKGHDGPCAALPERTREPIPPRCPAQWGERRCVDVAGHEGIHYAADGADWMDEPTPHPLRFPGVAREAFLRRFAEKWRREYQAGVDTPEVLQIAEVVDAVLEWDAGGPPTWSDPVYEAMANNYPRGAQ